MILRDEEGRIIIKVWDWETRVLHWANAALILILIGLALTYEFLEDTGVPGDIRHQVMYLHAYVGYLFIITVFLRVYWGFRGNEYAGWRDLWPFTAEKMAYILRKLRWCIRGFREGPAEFRYLGHDPLGSLFYLLLFLVVLSQIATGIALAGVDLHMAPWQYFFSGLGNDNLELLKEAAEELHEFGYFSMIFFIVVHVVGVVLHERHERTGILSSMINGVKFFPEDKLKNFKYRDKR
ncbi:MAG: cytochrome b/b6 domain-containing protein [Thermodesulfobacteriota bacterium]